MNNMNRSAEVSLLQGATPCKDFYRGQMQDFSVLSEHLKTGSTAGGATAAHMAAVEDTLLLELLIPACVKLEDREEERRELGVFLYTGRGGVNGLSRKVLVRLTDPSDPFFLFELELLEDDYGSFKQRLELLVDFSGFPKYLVSMLNGLVLGLTPYVVFFVVDSRDTARGLFRVLERTEFRTVDHISLTLMRQGDAGQKRYLAGRFQHFERAYTHAVAEHRAEAATANANIEALKMEVATLEKESRALREQLRREVEKSEKDQLMSVGQLREEHCGEMSRLRSSFDAELRDVTRKAEELQARLLDDVRTKDKELHEANQRITSLESTIVTLQSQLRVAGDKCGAQAKELEELRTSNSDLLDFRSRATRSLSENELSCVKLQERVRGLVQTLKSRDEELQSLREQYQKQDNYINIITSQNEQLAEQQKKSETSLAKAHHIIATQLKNMKGVKEREQMLQKQLHSQDTLLQEKTNSISRLRDELASSAEQVQVLQNKISELRDQLAKTDTAREKLAQELKQCQDALIHLQRSMSVTGRHWPVFGGTAATTSNNNNNNVTMNSGLSMGLSSSVGSTVFDVYKEFSKNANSTVRGAGRVPVGGPSAEVNGTTAAHNSAANNGTPLCSAGVGSVSAREAEGGVASAAKTTTTPAGNGGENIMSGESAFYSLDAATANVLFNGSKQAFSTKSFFGDGVNKTFSVPKSAAVGTAPSAYF